MSRTSKYALEAISATSGLKVWKAALYVRLSREDGDKEESDSVSNQRALLNDFAALQEDIEVYDVYVDDGWSGTNFERPDFLRMMQDIKGRLVDCVVVKDLSRFGRNYIEVGQYIEKVFPFMDVRFISVNDMLDSVKNPQAMNNLIVPFKNIINDEYCRDISNKVRSSLDMKRKQGKFIGSFATYGYLKDPSDHNHLIVDEEAAAVVQNIFAWFIAGMSIIGIAKKLNEFGILNPSAYKQEKGFCYRHPSGEKNDGMWPDSSVRRILRNEVYTGNLVQGKNKIKSYKVQVSVAVPQEQWIIVPNTHEAIISKETFEKAQFLFTRDTRTAPDANQVYLLAGFVKCADCGRAMNRKLISQPYKKYCYYICSTFKKMHNGACTKHTIRSDKLENAILETIRTQVALAVSMDEMVETINQRIHVKKSSARTLAALAAKKHERKQLEKMKLELYPDWKNGDITKNEYQQLKEQMDVRLASVEENIAALEQSMEETKNGVDSSNAFLSSFLKYRNIQTLTREILVELVDEVRVHEGGSITIRFKFADAFAQAAEYIEANTESAASA